MKTGFTAFAVSFISVFHAYRKSVPSQPNVIYAISRVRNGVRQTKSG